MKSQTGRGEEPQGGGGLAASRVFIIDKTQLQFHTLD